MNRHCSRPGCSTHAVATMVYDYESQMARLDRLAEAAHPMAYDLCEVHAERQTVPVGWTLRDDRVVHRAAFGQVNESLAS